MCSAIRRVQPRSAHIRTPSLFEQIGRNADGCAWFPAISGVNIFRSYQLFFSCRILADDLGDGDVSVLNPASKIQTVFP
jgi:hypothetical protein